MNRDLDPTSEAYARAERWQEVAQERYYKEMDTPEHRADAYRALRDFFTWDTLRPSTHDFDSARIDTEKFINGLNSDPMIALAIGLECPWAETFDHWQRENELEDDRG